MTERHPRPDRFVAKALLDPYYAPLAAAGASHETLRAAGFIDDLLDGSVRAHPCWSPAMLTTPLMKVRRALAQSPEDARKLVLLSTGSYSPMHEGHIALMERARTHAQELGYTVVGGYMSPSHDAYVSVKNGGTAALHAEQRIALAEEAVRHSDWLSICPWEARHAPEALNFTDVLDRLAAYLARHVDAIELGYVFGSDNLGFLAAFAERGLAFCGVRGEMTTEALRETHALLGGREHRLHMMPATRATRAETASSTKVRSGNLSLIPEAARARYRALVQPPSQAPTMTPAYLVRRDLAHATSNWGVDAAAQAEFEESLMDVLASSLGAAGVVHGIPLAAQIELATAAREPETSMLSLDACVLGDAQLRVSRLFDVGGGQVFSSQRVPRPGAAALALQLASLDRSRKWRVLDDDKATGDTEHSVHALLTAEGVQVAGFTYLNEAYLRGTELAEREVLDIVDARDFLLGARDGGLVIELPTGETARAPYMLPFVNLVFRAKIPAEACNRLSRQLWELNVAWLEAYAPRLTVSDADPASGALLTYLGFASTTTLGDCCNALSAWSGDLSLR
ncbi:MULTISPECIES: hypothetical protein [unclassified Variovorax]|uniref:hypothetical protein n=1 Tax=unclassified Variovorax TaxID=663243 RepID=UPI000A659A00|nr:MULTISPECIES: hypothetical protein [unclassified Variovorax]PNG50391.1 hypothetical protein CHC06_06015 [Variovorax sp. B2]PNG51264.1 hypothetical protein CHC07_05921 [Variovorax sp. B4]VTV17509.1 hypothetical protein WDL1P1_00443 [Variovorax sp. WDL1]